MIAEKAFMQPIERAQEIESHSGQIMMHWRFRKEEPLISAGTMDMHRRSAAWH